MKRSNSSRSRTLRTTLERLELRILMHAGHDHHAEQAIDPVGLGHELTGLRTLKEIIEQLDADGDGHITSEQYEGLSEAERAGFDTHLIGDPAPPEPIDYDAVLGIPSGVSATEAATYPDFFPKISGAITIDQTSQAGRTLVRFGTQVNNQGTGPAILLSGRPGVDPIPTGAPITSWVNPDGSQNVLQAVYNYNGTSYSLSHYLAAGRFTYHPGHGHFHFDGYAYYRLRHNVGGQPGEYVMRNDGTEVVGEKVGFCLINVTSTFVTEGGQSSSQLPGWNAPGQPATDCGLLQGVHVGKADVYSSSLTGQWIDVTGVPNGSYFIEIEIDAENAVTETDDSNNIKTFAYTLNVNPPPGGIPADEFDQGAGNDTFDTATDMGVMGTDVKTGLTIHWGQDDDYFKFEASSSGVYTVTSNQANGNVDLYLYDANRQQIGASTKPSGSESISFAFELGKTYYLRTEAYNSTTSSNYQVGWNLKPTTDSATSTPTIVEGGQPGAFVIQRNGPTTNPLTVNFTLSGTAQNGVDYELVAGSVTLGDLQSTAAIPIVALRDAIREGSETVILTITSNNAYVVGGTGSQIVIRDSNATLPFGTVSPDWDSAPDNLNLRTLLDGGLNDLALAATRLPQEEALDAVGRQYLVWSSRTLAGGAAPALAAAAVERLADPRDALFGSAERGPHRAAFDFPAHEDPALAVDSALSDPVDERWDIATPRRPRAT